MTEKEVLAETLVVYKVVHDRAFDLLCESGWFQDMFNAHKSGLISFNNCATTTKKRWKEIEASVFNQIIAFSKKGAIISP